MKRTSRAIVAIAASLSMALLAACGSDNNNSSSPQPSGSGGEGTIKIALVQKTLTSEFWQSIKSGAEARAAELGVDLTVYAANSEDDIEGQVNLLENAIGLGYDAIGVAPISNVNLNNVISQATEKGIYVVNVDEPVDVEHLRGLGGAVQGFVTTDNVAVGTQAGEFIVSQLDGPSEVALIEGKAGVASGVDRRDGARAALEAAGMTVVDSQPADWDRTQAFNLAQNYINKYPNLKAIYAANDTMAMGAFEAVKNSGKDIIVVGTDGNSDAIASVQEGGLAATVKQDAEGIGAAAVDLLVQLAKEKPAIDVSAQLERTAVEAILVSREG